MPISPPPDAGHHGGPDTAAAGERIPYDIVYCSSEDEPFPVTDLLRDDDAPGHRGWQTAKNPKYPQSLVLRFRGDVDLRQIQILSHECKIASKVEVRVFSLKDNGLDLDHQHHLDHHNVVMPSFRDVRFVKLGSVGFNSNEKSKHRSKERKTVHLKAVAYFIKLNFQKCHVNSFNTSNQVGVYSIVCCGFQRNEAPYHVDPAILPAPPPHETPQHMSHEQRMHMSPSAMSEHGLPPIHGARAPVLHGGGGGGHYPSTYAPSSVHNENIRGGVVYTHHSAPAPHSVEDPASYYTPAAPSLELPYQQQVQKLPPISANRHRAAYQSPPHKHATAHPHDVAVIPDPVPSAAGHTYRSQVILDFDVIYASRTEELVRIKSRAVDEEDFDAAKECKDALKQLHHAAQQVYDLEREKVRCIYSEDFDEAKHFKTEMDAYVGELYQTVPGGVERFLQHNDAEGGDAYRQPPSVHGPITVGGGTKKQRQTSEAPAERRGVIEMPPIEPRGVGGKGVGAVSLKHSFEDEPVRSKYAIAMAQRREEHPSDDEAVEQGEDGEANPPQSDAVQHELSANEPPVGAGEDAALLHHQVSSGMHPANNASHDEDEGSALDNSGLPTMIDAFDVNILPKWEQEVYRVIHAEAQEDAPAAPLQPTGSHTEAAECIRVLGNYMTACLLSKRWKLREAAIRALSSSTSALYAQHVPVANVVQIVLKFFDIKGYGLQDPIGNVFLASCEFVHNTLQDKFECLSAVLPQVLNLLPRFIARAGDAAQKTRDEAAATVLAYVSCNEVGINHVATTILADPIDQDKRRISTQNHRIQLARLALWQQLMTQCKLTLTPSLLDTSMTKLIVPCLNHSSSEVRDLAVTVVTLNVDNNYDVAKYLNMVGNPAIKASLTNIIEGRDGKKGGGGGNSSARRNSSAGRQRNSSAGKQRNTSAPRRAASRTRNDGNPADGPQD